MAARAARWLVVGLAIAATAKLLHLAGLSSTTIIAALVVGIVVALRFPGRMKVSRAPAIAAPAAIGVLLGADLTGSALHELSAQWLGVVLAVAATAAIYVVLGMLLARYAPIDPSTAMLSVTPGAASGIVIMSRELGGDDRLVAFAQYSRVIIIVISTPLLVSAMFPQAGAPSAVVAAPTGGDGGLFVIAALMATGWLGARALRLPAAALLGPLLVTAAWTIAVPAAAPVMPPLLRETAFAVIGVQIGLRFTPAVVSHAQRLAPAFLFVLVALLLGCGVIAVVLSALTSIDMLDAYLATTPGGLTVVAAVSYGSGAETGLVVAVQSVRLLTLLLLAPLAVRLATARARRAGVTPESAPR